MWCSVVVVFFGFASGDQRVFNSRMHEHAMRIKQMRETMSWKMAATVLDKMDAQSLQALQPILDRAGGRKNLRRHNALVSALEMGATSLTTATQPPSKLGGALKLMNGMVKEAEYKYETELERCCHYEKSQNILLEETHTAISVANTKSAECKKSMLEAQTCITMCETQLPRLKHELSSWTKQCNEEIETLDLMLKSLEGDIDVTSKILVDTKCTAANKSASSGLNLLQCEDECGQYTTVEGIEAMSPRGKDAALKLLSHSGPKGAPLEVGTTRKWRMQTTLPLRTLSRARPCKAAVSLHPASAKCSIEVSPVCKTLVEKFMHIATSLLETQIELQMKRKVLTDSCKTTRENYLTQIEEYEVKLKDCNTMFAGATGCNVEALEISRLKGAQLTQFQLNYKEMTTECHANYVALEAEICGLTKIRGEVSKHITESKTSGRGGGDLTWERTVYQDCQVSDWVEVEPGCSRTCGGGVVKLARTIEVYPAGGADCPFLVKMETCNEDKCPVDCRIGDWSGWSDCSAKCGGGVQDRNRPILKEPMYGGIACGEIQQVQSCNAQSCDKDCVLSDWTTWTKCSKQCDTGHQLRFRNVLESQVGDGTCPTMSGNARLNKQLCNPEPCHANVGELLQCRAKRDVIVLIDGSGSVGKVGWKLQMNAAKMMVRAINPGVNRSDMGIIVYSGPEWLCDWYRCMGTHESSLWFRSFCSLEKDFNNADCGTQVLSHLTTDNKSLDKILEEAKYPERTTFTSKALGEVEAELSLGRKDSEPVVVVMTDGYPADKQATARAAKKLAKKAKIIWVPITKFAPLDDINSWAADPEDVIPVDDFINLDESVINKITATACDDLDVISLKEFVRIK